MAIDRQELKVAFMSCLEDDAILDRLCDRLAERIEATVNFAVAEAVAEKDREIQELKEKLHETSDQVNELEQYSRKQCVSISGVSEMQGEDVAQRVLEIARAAGAELSPGELDVAHRVGRPREGKQRAIIARFVSFTARQKVYDKRRDLRTAKAAAGSSLTTAELKKIYISDSLTKRNEETMYTARQLRKEGRVWAAWTDNGKMKIKLVRNGPTKIILSTRNLRELVGDLSPPAGEPGTATAATRSRSADPPRGNDGSSHGRTQPSRAAATRGRQPPGVGRTTRSAQATSSWEHQPSRPR